MTPSKGIKILQVRCLLCHETLRYSREYTRPLIEHLKRRHPYINIARLPSLPDSGDQLYMKNSMDGLNNPPVNSYIAMGKDNTWQFVAPRETDNSPVHSTPLQADRRLSSIDASKQWLLGGGKLLCPKCGTRSEPVMKKKEQSNYNVIARACFMLWCWPFSYMALNLCADHTVKLFCNKCSTYIASYDLQNNKIIDLQSAVSHRRNIGAVVAKLSTSAPSINMKSKSWEGLKPERLPLSHSSIK